MHRTGWFTLALVVCLMSARALHAAEPQITQLPGGGWQVHAKTYSAHVDAKGGLVSLRMGDIELLGEGDKTGKIGAPFPGDQPPTSINLRGRMLAIRNDKVRVEYTFEETALAVETEGAQWVCQMAPPPFTAFVTSDGTVRPGNTGGIGGVTRFIIGSTAFESSQGFHYMRHSLVPSVYPSGKKKPADVFSFRLEFGLSADATALVEVRALNPLEARTDIAPTYAKGKPARFDVQLANLGVQDRTVDISYTLGTHYWGGTQSDPVRLPSATVPAGQAASSQLEIPVDKPGCYWVNFQFLSGNQVLKREQRFFLYDPDGFNPPLTRPADFKQFWQKQLAALRAEPLKVTTSEVPDRSTDTAVYYNFTITVRGQQYKGVLTVPRKAGKHLAVLGGRIRDKATDGDRVLLQVEHNNWPMQATFTRWADESDNNLLDCYLLAVRLADYLRSRPDVDRIYLTGASRQGPIQLANAALDPTRIAGVDAHVPTSLGVSWSDYAYKGWGSVPRPPSMANYVDPVNFAPDIVVPYIVNVGCYDGLSPVPGALAFHNYAVNSPFRRFCIELGMHGYFNSSFRGDAQKELDAYVKAHTEVEQDERVLKEH